MIATPLATDQNINNLGMNKSSSGGNIFGGKGFSFGSSNIFGITPNTTSETNTTTDTINTSATFTFGTKLQPQKETDVVSEEDNEKEVFAAKSLIKPSSIKLPDNFSSFSFATASKDLDNSNTESTKLIDSEKASTAVSGFGSTVFGGGNDVFGTKKSFSFVSSMNSTTKDTETKVPEISTTKSSTPPSAAAPPTNIFGSSMTTFGFGSAAAAPSVSVDTNDMFKTDSSLSFASLATSSTTAKPFSSNTTVPPSGFFGLTNTDDFSRFSSPSSKLNGSNVSADADNSATGEDNYDPHYDPIIALPKEIVVSTGEENEVKLFGERGKLYRYDSSTKEWKERGKSSYNFCK